LRTILDVTGTNTLRLHRLTGGEAGLAPVDRVSLRIDAGTTVAILGDGASGKESLLRLIAGFGAIHGGAIEFNGVDITGLAAHQRPFTLLTAQDAVFPHMSVAQNVSYGLRPRAAKRKEHEDPRVVQALAMVEMTEAARAFPEALNGAERQKVALARALAVEPLVLLLDDALSELDPLSESRLLGRLRDLQRQAGFSIMAARRDGMGVMAAADTMAVMADGRIVEAGRPQTLYAAPSTALAASLTGPVNLLDGDALGGVQNVVRGSMTDRGAFSGPDWVLALRPDIIDLHLAAPQDDSPRIEGRIETVVFAASGLSARIRLPGSGPPLEVRVDPRRLDADDLPEGRRVWCTWDDGMANAVQRHRSTRPDDAGRFQEVSR